MRGDVIHGWMIRIGNRERKKDAQERHGDGMDAPNIAAPGEVRPASRSGYACPVCGFPHDTVESSKRRKPECWRQANRLFPPTPNLATRTRDKRRRRTYARRLMEGFRMQADFYVFDPRDFEHKV